ncbi:response regulator [Candidatus Falkowbacteria bacterium]|nr:response regulator [Candidatus Falkowbacteria bacterium]
MPLKQTILMVEDELDLAEVFSLKLREIGYNVLIVLDGKTGLAMIKQKKPSLVLLDLVLPEMDGYEVLKAIKGDKSLSGVKVYVWSNLTQKDEIERAEKLGVDGYLIKSDYTPTTLSEKIKEVLNK